MAQFVNTKLANPVQLSSGSTVALYTVPANTSVILSSLAIANNEAVERHVSVYLCPAGVAASNSNILLPFVPIAANTLVNIGIGQTILATDVVRVLSDGDYVVIHTSGIKII